MKVAEADIKEAISDFFWDDNAGPFENLFRWFNRFFLMVSKGPLFFLGIALTAIGIDFSDLGRMIDEKHGLKDLSDINRVDPEQIGEEMSGLLMSQVSEAAEPTTSHLEIPLFKRAQDPGEDTAIQRARKKKKTKDLAERRLEERRLSREQRERFRQEDAAERGRKEEAAETRRKEDLERSEKRRQEDLERSEKTKQEAEKRRKEDTAERRRRETRADRRERQRARSQARRHIGAGKMRKAVLGAGLAYAVSRAMQSVSNPRSLLSRVLRGAGILGAEEIGKEPEEGRTRQVGKPGVQPQPTTNLKTRLENKVEQILQ